MSYESPITMVSELINTQLRQDGDRYVADIEKKVGFHVDKQELIKALAYDRDQYQKGYDDAMKRRVGKWILWTDDYKDYCKCSVCDYGEEGEVLYGEESRYCPYCGAEMEREKQGHC